MRALSGVNVAEFLLPLLVLDVACFGDGDEGAGVITEMRLVLNGGTEGGRAEGIAEVAADNIKR